FLTSRRRHPTPTLFPYTTLFRSEIKEAVDQQAAAPDGRAEAHEKSEVGTRNSEFGKTRITALPDFRLPTSEFRSATSDFRLPHFRKRQTNEKHQGRHDQRRAHKSCLGNDFRVIVVRVVEPQ